MDAPSPTTPLRELPPRMRAQSQPPRQPVPEAEDEIDLSRWVEAFRRRWKLLAVVAGVVLGIAVLLYVIMPRSYRATTTIQIERNVASVVPIDSAAGWESYWDAQSFYPTQYKLLESRGLAERVVKQLDLASNPTFNPPRESLLGDDEAGETTAADDERVLGVLARRLQANLEVEPVRDTRLVEISYSSGDPELAARIVNGVTDAYIDWGIESRTENLGLASSFLASQIEEVKQEIADKEAQLNAYARRTDIVALDPRSNVVLQRLEGLNRDYTAAMSERIEKEAAYQEVMNAPRETVADTYSEGMVAQLRRDLLQKEQEYQTKLETYKPEWPAMQELKAEIEAGRRNLSSVIDEMAEEAKKTARAAYQTALRREQSLKSELERQKSDALALNSAAVEYNNLLVEVQTRRELLDSLLQQRSETGVADRLQGTRSSNVIVVDRALVPQSPHRPSLPRNVALGLVLGLMLGTGTLVGAELLDRTLRTGEDVDRVLGLPLLGTVPDIREGTRRGYGFGRRSKDEAEAKVRIEGLPHDHPRLAAAEAYRSVRTSVMLSTAGGIRSVVVTSSEPGEGKTTTAVNLAVVLAQLGKRVLLIDTDLRKARLHEVFSVSNRTGLVTLLATGGEIDDVITETRIPNLFLTPAGPAPPNASELLASDAMRAFFDEVSERFDFVVMDSSPLVAVSDATVLGSMADGVILCLGAGIVTREHAVAAVERLDIGSVRLLGAVLNLYRNPGRGYGYYGAYAAYGDDRKIED